MIEYKLIKSNNKNSQYPYVVIRSHPRFFNYYFCTYEDLDKFKGNLEKLYEYKRQIDR